MNAAVLRSVFKRNFVAYFANPTGYLFICMFVLLSTVAAFWPNEFFNTNLANLDQLSFGPANPFRSFPFIMLVFIPAITMGIWAEERRQGTDELLLTIPAADLDIVLGKYLAAVAIFSVALLFSLVSNFVVLRILGDPDTGLFLATYLGYWLTGLAMLAVGMVASFLTSNLTIAYILGAALNAPLVFAVFAEGIAAGRVAHAIKQWSITEQFRDFGRGILSLSGLLYFGTIAAVMLYLSMVFIGRRHWRRATLMRGHYTVRTLSLAAIALSAVVFFSYHDVRVDVTSERLSSLSPQTLHLLKSLNLERPVQIEAFISPEVPESYVQTRLNLIAMLREMAKRGGAKVQLTINDTEQYSETAARAEKRYEITPREVTTLDRGTYSRQSLFMGVAFTCGLEKVILPFIDRGIPVEYELVRSIATVTEQQRKKIGILDTDAQLYGGFDMQMMSSSANWPIVDELQKQYQVERVDPNVAISDDYDALLAVQPSSLGPEAMENFVAAVRRGVPTAIFEDPLPVFAGNVPGTTAPKRPPGGMNPMMMQQPPPQKGDRVALWDLLQVDFGETQVVWQDYNPYPKLADLPKEFVFVDRASGAEQPFNPGNAISSGLQHLLFPFPGSIRNLNVSKMKFTPLVTTSTKTGSVNTDDVFTMSLFGMGGDLNPNRSQQPTHDAYVLAAHITGTPPGHLASDEGDGDGAEDGDEEPPADGADEGAAEAASSEPDEPARPRQGAINVVLVADIDMLHRNFFRLREQGDVPEAGIHFDFDNVTFVLNVLDKLAGDDRFIEIRKRRPKHRTLTRIEKSTEQARRETAAAIERLREEYRATEEEEDEKLRKRIDDLRKEMESKNLPTHEVLNRVGMAQQDGERRKATKLEQLKQQQDREINRIETNLNLEVRRLQNLYKMWAVFLPPIPPLLIGGVVFFTRRAREREGVARSRLRS